MPVTGDFFEVIRDKKNFLELVHEDFSARSEELSVYPHWNRGRAQDAYFQWMQDLERVEAVEDKVGRADHLKCAAHLIYWLRRSSPVDEFAYEPPVDSAKEFMLKYGREYLAFDLGYRAAQIYERRVFGRNLPEQSFSLQSNLPGIAQNDFIETTVHVLKVKHVSPHALLAILKAIFLRP